MLGKLEVEGGQSVSSFSDPNERNLVSEVSITEPRVFGHGNPVKVCRCDCGCRVRVGGLLICGSDASSRTGVGVGASQ